MSQDSHPLLDRMMDKMVKANEETTLCTQTILNHHTAHMFDPYDELWDEDEGNLLEEMIVRYDTIANNIRILDKQALYWQRGVRGEAIALSRLLSVASMADFQHVRGQHTVDMVMQLLTVINTLASVSIASIREHRK